MCVNCYRDETIYIHVMKITNICAEITSPSIIIISFYSQCTEFYPVESAFMDIILIVIHLVLPSEISYCPTVSIGPLNPGPPAATYPLLAPDLVELTQKEYILPFFN